MSHRKRKKLVSAAYVREFLARYTTDELRIKAKQAWRPKDLRRAC